MSSCRKAKCVRQFKKKYARDVLHTPSVGHSALFQGCQLWHHHSGTFFLGLGMQRVRDGLPAKGVTRAEFIDFLKRVKQRVETEISGKAQAAWEKKCGKGARPIYSFDNPRIHGGRNWAEVMRAAGISDKAHYNLSVNSPDLHRIIEHTHTHALLGHLGPG